MHANTFNLNSLKDKRKVLVIDDEVIIQEFLKDVLEQSGYDVICAGDYDNAFQAFSSHDIDLVLSDICLPGGHNGIDILKRAKSINPDIPVVMITGIPNVETASNALRHGAYEYLTKPLKTLSIIDVVNKAIKSRIQIEQKKQKDIETEEYKIKLRKEIEQKTNELQITQDNYSKLIEHSPEMICIIDESLKILQINKTMFEHLGYSMEEISKLSITDLIPKKNHNQIIKHYKEVFQLKNQKPIECNFIKKNGDYLDVEIHSTAHKSTGSHAAIHASSYVRDITNHNLLVNKLIETEKQATLGQFAGCIGHEMNNLVTSLIGYIELVRETPDDVHLIKRIIDIFDTQTQRIHVLSENLLTLSAKRPEKKKDLSLDKVVDMTIELLKPTGRIKSCVFVREYDKNLPKILGDELKFQQLLTNLIINASDSMENKGVITIRLKGQQSGKKLLLEVEDHGCGIPKEHIKKLFEGFFTTKPLGKGTGLGMLVVKEIVERYKGKISISSQENKGTKISIIFPVK